MPTGTAERAGLADAYLLHRRHYRETSLLLDVFSREHGILRLLAKGALRAKSGRFALLQPFLPLGLAWTARGAPPVLTAAEARGRPCGLPGKILYCGFYLNELLLRLLPEQDPHPGVFAIYEQALQNLQDGGPPERSLRLFELALLAEIGYGLELERDVASGEAIQPQRHYLYHVEHGPVESPQGAGTIRGAALLGLRDGALAGPAETAEAKRLMRKVIDHHLGGRALKSRELFAAGPSRRE